MFAFSEFWQNLAFFSKQKYSFSKNPRSCTNFEKPYNSSFIQRTPAMFTWLENLGRFFLTISKIWNENDQLKWCVFLSDVFQSCSFSERISDNPKKFFLTRRKKFWQPCRKFFAKNPMIFRSKSGNDFEFFFFKKMIFLKSSPGQIECSSDNHAEVFLCFLPKKKLSFFGKKIWFLFKIVRGGNFAAECKSIEFFPWKCLFQLNFEFLEKKSVRFQVWKKYKVWRRKSFFLKIFPIEIFVLPIEILNKIGGPKNFRR